MNDLFEIWQLLDEHGVGVGLNTEHVEGIKLTKS